MKRYVRKVVVVSVLGLSLAGILTAGACDTKADAPDPAPGNIINGTNTRVIKMPDGFRNVVATCDGTTGIYVTSRGDLQADPQPSSIALFPNDPKCR